MIFAHTFKKKKSAFCAQNRNEQTALYLDSVKQSLTGRLRTRHQQLLRKHFKLMPSALFSQEAAAPLILSTLLRRRQVRPPLRSVLLSSAHADAIVQVLQNAQERAAASDSTSAFPKLSTQRNANLLKDLPGFSPAASRSASSSAPPSALHVVTLGCAAAPSVRRGSAEVVALPLTLAEVSAHHRLRHRNRLPSRSSAGLVASCEAAPLALLEGGRGDTIRRDSVDLFCGPGSTDLMVVEVTPHAESEDALWEALFVAECTLAEGGSLLAVAPHVISPRVRDFLRWRFRSSVCAAAPHGAGHYAFCSALAADFGTTAVRREDFPGTVSNRQRRRPRHWNPYRREEAKKFVMSVRPGFTNAPHTKDALLRSVAREKEREEQLRDADDAFFAVAHGMVEKGTHYSQPSD